jgi:hypothetical protein
LRIDRTPSGHWAGQAAGMPYPLTEPLSSGLSWDGRSSLRLARRTRTRLATFDRDNRRYDRMIVTGAILIALSPAWMIIVGWFLNLLGLL